MKIVPKPKQSLTKSKRQQKPKKTTHRHHNNAVASTAGPLRFRSSAAAFTTTTTARPRRQHKQQPLLHQQHAEFSAQAPTEPPLVTANDVLSAYSRIKDKIEKTPFEQSLMFSKLTGANIYLKMESHNAIGSFKQRGALNKMLGLDKEAMVVCSSAGNHSQACSISGTALGLNTVIVMPETSPHVKVQKTAGFGGHVILHGKSFQEAFEFAQQMGEFEGRTFVHAFNDEAIVAGAGTVACEMLEQMPFLDAVIVPLGGGGLIAGMATLLKHVNPRIKIYGVEAENMAGMKKSLEAGHVVSVPKCPTMADGIAIENVGTIPYNVISRYVDKVVTVSEDDMAHTILQMLELEKALVEPAGIVGLTAATGILQEEIKGKNVGVVISGSNIDMSLLGRIVSKGLVRSGRLARIAVTIRDVPGQLAKICQICSESGANIKEIRHERAFVLSSVGTTMPILDIETRGFDHIERVVQRLKNEADFIDCHVITPFH